MSSLSNSEIDVLIKKCLQGNEQSKQALYQKFASPMYAVCMRYVKNTDDAQDLLHDGFIKIFSNLASFKATGPFEAWMRRIFVNTALEFLRKRKAQFQEMDLENAPEIPVEPTALTGIGIAEIMKALNSLADGYRTVFNLYVMEGFSHAEIGDMLGISEQTSKSQLSRARAQLQKKLLRF